MDEIVTLEKELSLVAARSKLINFLARQQLIILSMLSRQNLDLNLEKEYDGR